MSRRINIMQIVLSLECGGLEKIAIDLAERLNGGIYNSCICCLDRFGELADEANNKGIEVSLVKRKPGKDFSLPFRLARLIKEKRIDLVHTHNMGSLFYGTLAAKLAGVRGIINTRHGREKKHKSTFIWSMNDAIVAISEDAKQQMLKWNLINTKKTRVIYNGINVNNYSMKEGNGEAKKVLNMDPSAFVIGTVARLSPEKDQFTLIDAFSTVINKIGNARLVFVGNGVLKGELEAYVKSLGLSDKVLFFGFRSNVSEILPAFDIFALSSLTEGISLTLLEAMAAGKPIVATDVGGNPEVVEDGITGFLVPAKSPDKMADAIIRILTNAELAKKMGEAARKRVEEKFSLDRMVREYEELYEECLGKRLAGRNKNF